MMGLVKFDGIASTLDEVVIAKVLGIDVEEARANLLAGDYGQPFLENSAPVTTFTNFKYFVLKRRRQKEDEASAAKALRDESRSRQRSLLNGTGGAL